MTMPSNDLAHVASTESLTFAVRPVVTHADLKAACEVRADAYGSKRPEIRDSMAVPDSIDLSPATTVYLCERKQDQQPVGSMRVQLAGPGTAVLEIEKYAGVLPAYAERRRAEITRLSAVSGGDPFIRLALWKVAYLHCRAHTVALILVGARRPSLVRTYRGMGYREVMPPIPLPYAANLPHCIMAADLAEAEAHWRNTRHPMLEFMLRHHADIDVVSSMQHRPVHEVVRVLQR